MAPAPGAGVGCSAIQSDPIILRELFRCKLGFSLHRFGLWNSLHISLSLIKISDWILAII